MKKEKFEAGYPQGVESLMVGRVDFGETFRNVSEEISNLNGLGKRTLLMMVACDRIYGFFETRGGVVNGPKLKELVRGLAVELKLERIGKKGEDVSVVEARGYYDQLVSMGVVELAKSIGERDVFCTLWGSINEYVEAEKPSE